jgi:hypothetical protein
MRHVALCGNPKSGKTAIAEELRDTYGYTIVDDGDLLRRAAIILYGPYGMQPSDPYTQEGKARVIDVLGKSYTVRDLLGSLGSMLEEKHGEAFIPAAILASLRLDDDDDDDDDETCYVFPSVRKTQGAVYAEQGIPVVEIVRDGATPSPYGFDAYAKYLTSFTIENNTTIQEAAAMLLLRL